MKSFLICGSTSFWNRAQCGQRDRRLGIAFDQIVRLCLRERAVDRAHIGRRLAGAGCRGRARLEMLPGEETGNAGYNHNHRRNQHIPQAPLHHIKFEPELPRRVAFGRISAQD
jgi:hypothetical protein